jgi:hypothetical protein
MNHTKEPWEARRDPSYYGIVSEVYAGDKFILGTGGVHSPSELEANTKRIVACVNACEGITNEALEAGIVLDSVKLHEAILDQQPSSFFKEYGLKVWEDV